MKGSSDHAGNEDAEYDTGGSLIATEQSGPMTWSINRLDRLGVRNQGRKYNERDQSGINQGCKDTIAGRGCWGATIGRA